MQVQADHPAATNKLNAVRPTDRPMNSTKACIVSFSGMDGAGKSTQMAALTNRLGTAGFQVRIFSFWDDVARLGRLREFMSHTLFKSEKGVGSPEKPVNRKDKNVQTWYLTLCRFVSYFVD